MKLKTALLAIRLPGYLWFPLTLKNPTAIALLGYMITLTPGTLSLDLSPDRRYLLVHCFDLKDRSATEAAIRLRFEGPLLKIFEC